MPNAHPEVPAPDYHYFHMGERYPITLLPGGERFEADAGEPVLAAALRAGHLLPHACRGGNCGSCRATVVGAWHYRNATAVPLGLTDAERAQGMVLLCQAVADGELVVTAQPVTTAGAATVQSLPARIAHIDRLAPDVAAVFLQLPTVEPLRYRAGQYLDIVLPDARRRSYSAACAPRADGHIELHVRERPGGAFSGAALRVGALLRIEGPYGSFMLRDGERPVLLVAGSTGFAPFKAMLEQAIADGAKRRIELWWGARAPEGLYHAALLDRWQRAHPAFRWHGVVGAFVHERVLALLGPGIAELDAYIAGPPPMVRAAREAFAKAGVTANFDSFEAAEK